MRRPATREDILATANGHLANGGLLHDKCGGEIHYSLVIEHFRCDACQTTWSMKMVKISNQKPFDADFWIPPMIVAETDEDL